MKRNLLILVWVVFEVLFFSTQSWAVCPEDTVDSGECDTLYVEIYPPDQLPLPPWPFFVRFPIYVTHDVPDPSMDSIQGFVIPLCYTHSNSSKYCSLSGYWNNINLYPQSDLDRSILRHFIEGQDTLMHNWMMDLSQKQNGEEWDTRILDLDGTSNFWLTLAVTGMGDRRFEEGGRTLIATMTFKLEDTMKICIDSCFWPPVSYLAFGRGDGQAYVPRHLMPICEYVGPCWPGISCPQDEWRHTNGTFQTSNFSAWCYEGGGSPSVYFEDVPPPGITDIEVVYTIPPPQEYVEGYVVYTVTDHCQEGGRIELGVSNGFFNCCLDFCEFYVWLSDNHPPVLNLPDTWRALADYTMGLRVSASDPDNDSVAIVMDAFWYEPDSLQPPTNPPSYDGGNPGFFTWVPTEADTGVWICSFLATDVCGAVDTHQVIISVGITYCGDCLEDALIDLGDLLYLVSYLYKEGPSPDPLCRGDASCDGVVDLGDVLYLINYLYKSGPAPCFVCCAGVSSTPFSKPKSPN